MGDYSPVKKEKKNDKCRGVFTFKQPHILTKNCHFMVVKGYRDIKLKTEPKSVLHERKLVVFAFYTLVAKPSGFNESLYRIYKTLNAKQL